MEPITFIVNGQRVDAHGNVYVDPESAEAPDEPEVEPDAQEIPGRWAVTDPEGLIPDDVWEVLNVHFDGPEEVAAAEDGDILALDGVGKATLTKIREVIG